MLPDDEICYLPVEDENVFLAGVLFNSNCIDYSEYNKKLHEFIRKYLIDFSFCINDINGISLKYIGSNIVLLNNYDQVIFVDNIGYITVKDYLYLMVDSSEYSFQIKEYLGLPLVKKITYINPFVARIIERVVKNKNLSKKIDINKLTKLGEKVVLGNSGLQSKKK